MNERMIRAILGWGLIVGQLVCIGLALWLASEDKLDKDHGELSATISAIMPLLGVHLVRVVKQFLNQAHDEASLPVSPERFAVSIILPAMLVACVVGALLYKWYGPFWSFSSFIWTFGLLQTTLGASVAIIVEAIFPAKSKSNSKGRAVAR
jgi:hypothetical protein